MKNIILSTMLLATTVVFAELPSGHPSLPDTKENNQTNTSVPLPNEGRVTNTIDSGGYTYIEVDKSGAEEWLAAPRTELKKGERIRYSKGLLMKDFYSNSLKKSFDRILFVGSVKVVKQ